MTQMKFLTKLNSSSKYYHEVLTYMQQFVPNLCIMTNFSSMQDLWLAVVKLHSSIISIVYKQIDK